jgi:hypothetical protein
MHLWNEVTVYDVLEYLASGCRRKKFSPTSLI